MTANRKSRPRATPPWLLLVLLAATAATVYLVWRAHPDTWEEAANIVLAGLILELVGLVVTLPIGLLTGAYRKRPDDYGAPRRRRFGFVAGLMILLIGGLYLFGNNIFWLPKFAPREIWSSVPWDPKWRGYWVVQGLWTGGYAALILASALVQGAWDEAERRRWRKLAASRRPPVVLDAV
jgi:hypothetical protein